MITVGCIRMPRYAAIDIGSNSIRMLAAEARQGAPMTELAAARRVVRLGQSVFREGKLSSAAMDTACEALAEMAAEYRKWDVLAVRAVGTAALRDAVNRAEFLARAAQVLGTQVEVISGMEEARLIHLGVQARWPQQRRLLILDIGGGSAELIFSDGGRIDEAFSKPLGAVRLTEVFLKSDPPDPRELARLEKYCQERISAVGSKKVERMVATSATAAAAVCAVNRVRRSRRDTADRQMASAAQIRKLYAEVARRDLAGRARITGIGPRRAEIIVAGVAVLDTIMRGFRIPRMYYSMAGVRDGIIADMVHRKAGQEAARLDADQRRVVQAVGRRYGVSAAHARKVAQLAAMLFEATESLHRLPPAYGRILDAAAHLYNIGHYVNDSRHHKHSMYLVMNSDLAGFTDQERMAIANVSRYHRKSMPQPTHTDFQMLDPEARNAVVLLSPLLRLAVALDQSQEQKVERIETSIHEHSVEIRLISGRDTDIEQWHAATTADVFREVYGRQLLIRGKR